MGVMPGAAKQVRGENFYYRCAERRQGPYAYQGVHVWCTKTRSAQPIGKDASATNKDTGSCAHEHPSSMDVIPGESNGQKSRGTCDPRPASHTTALVVFHFLGEGDCAVRVIPAQGTPWNLVAAPGQGPVDSLDRSLGQQFQAQGAGAETDLDGFNSRDILQQVPCVLGAGLTGQSCDGSLDAADLLLF